MGEIANGYSWFKFDIEGWLSSPEVLQMTMAERGMYITLLAVQGRDGKLHADVDFLAKQAAVDRRGLKKWLAKWGKLMPIIELAPDTEVAMLQQPCSKAEACLQQVCSKCAPKWLQVRYILAASWMQTGRNRVNPKLWNLQVKSGKLEGQPLLEEKRVEGVLDLDLEGDREIIPDLSQVKLTMSANRTPSPVLETRKVGFGVE